VVSSVSAWIACALLGLLTAGCGSPDAGAQVTPSTRSADPDVALPGRLDGDEVARMAERELEAENATIAAGTMRCPDLALVVGASVRCRRTVALSEGRVVEMRGTVAVASLAAGGRLHVALDDEVVHFGVAGHHLAADVRKRYLRELGGQATVVRCPYLPGRPGASVTCRLSLEGGPRVVRVVVTAVDPETYRTTYTIDAADTADPADTAD
jgi:hypothetical protein